MGKQEKEGPVTEELDVVNLFSPVEKAEMRVQVARWKENLDELAEWFEDDLLYQIQVLSKLARGDKSLPGRTGQNIFARAIRDYNALATEVMDMLRRRDEKGTGKK